MNQLRALWDQLRAWYASRPQRDQRIYLGVAVAGVLSLLYVGIWVPIRDHRDAVAEEIDQKQHELERSARFLGAADALRAERDGLKKKLDAARKELLPGNSGTLGAAALQERTNTTATEKGVSVQSVQVMREEEFDPYRRVAVRLTVSTELKPLAEMIAALEYNHHLVIPFLEVSRRGAVVPGQKGPRTLQATIEVNGFVVASGSGEKDVETPEPEAPAAGSDATPPPIVPDDGAPAVPPAGPAASAPAAPPSPLPTTTVPPAAPVPPAETAPPPAPPATPAPATLPPAPPQPAPPTDANGGAE